MELSDSEAKMNELKEQLRTKDEALTKLNKDLMIKQKSLADMHITITRHSSDLEEWQRVCQEQSDKISIMQQEVEEKGEELVKTKGIVSDLHNQLLQQSDCNTTVMQEHREEVRQVGNYAYAAQYTHTHTHTHTHTPGLYLGND